METPPDGKESRMTWKLFAATFWLIFLAELGDKTQLAVMLQSAIHGRAGVFWAASLALVLSTLLAVFLGGLIAKVVSERVIHAVGGVLFLVFGLVMVYSAIRPGPDIAPILQAVEKTAED